MDGVENLPQEVVAPLLNYKVPTVRNIDNIRINSIFSFSVRPVCNHILTWKWTDDLNGTITIIGPGIFTTVDTFEDRAERLQALVRNFFNRNCKCKFLSISASRQVLDGFRVVDTPMNVRCLQITGSFDVDPRLEYHFWTKFNPDRIRVIDIDTAPVFFFELPVAINAKILRFRRPLHPDQLRQFANLKAKLLTVSNLDGEVLALWTILPDLFASSRRIGFCLNVGNFTIEKYEELTAHVNGENIAKKWIGPFPCITIATCDTKEINIYLDYGIEYLRVIHSNKNTAKAIAPLKSLLSLRSIMAITQRLPFAKRRSFATEYKFIENLLPKLPFHLKTLTVQLERKGCTFFEAEGVVYDNSKGMARFVLSLIGKTVQDLMIKGPWTEQTCFEPITVTNTFSVEKFNKVFKVQVGSSMKIELENGVLMVDGNPVSHDEPAAKKVRFV